jgi:hypothetical protein
MNRNDFIQIIRERNVTDRETFSEVRDMIGLFPWFQSAHMIMLKALHDSGDIKFATQLRQSALHVADREVLYYLINSKPSVPSADTAASAGQSPAAEARVTDREQVVIEEGRNSQELIIGIEKENISANTVTPPDSTQTEYILEVTAESDTDESASVVLVIDTDEEHLEETVTYMDPSISLPEPVTDLLELDESGPADERDSDAAAPENGIGNEGTRKKLQAELIDRFIETNPRIEPVKAKTEHPQEDIAAKYTEVRGELVTETLAKIYVTQGYYSRAIDIYEKLSLKFPEKSSYFATQIEKIKELIK